MIKVDNIITLASGKDYLLLDKTTLENEDFYLAVAVDKDEEPIFEDYKYIKAVNENGKEYIEYVEEEELKKVLTTIFAVNYSELAEEMKNSLSSRVE